MLISLYTIIELIILKVNKYLKYDNINNLVNNCFNFKVLFLKLLDIFIFLEEYSSIQF